MRLLPGGPDHVGERVAGVETSSVGCGHRRGDEREHLPLWHLHAHTRRHQESGRASNRRHAGGLDMITERSTKSDGTRYSRREFLQASAIAGGGLLFTLTVPMPAAGAASAEGSTSLNAFIRITPDGIGSIIPQNPE